jgi:hypothetical protein
MPGTESNMLGIKRVREDHLSAAHKSPHFGQAAKDPKECLRCHWKKLDIESFRDGVRGTQQEIDWRSFKDPTETRKEFGNEREGYPGTEKAKG